MGSSITVVFLSFKDFWGWIFNKVLGKPIQCFTIPVIKKFALMPNLNHSQCHLNSSRWGYPGSVEVPTKMIVISPWEMLHMKV